MSNIIEHIWNSVYESGFEMKKNWNDIKKSLEKYNLSYKCEWLSQALEINKDVELFLEENNLSIKNKQANLLNLLEIGFYAGVCKKKCNNKNFLDFYDKHNLSSYISYVTPHSITKMNAELSKEHPVIREIREIRENNNNNILLLKEKANKYEKKINRLNL
jgi:hypothetical protein